MNTVRRCKEIAFDVLEPKLKGRISTLKKQVPDEKDKIIESDSKQKTMS